MGRTAATAHDSRRPDGEAYGRCCGQCGPWLRRHAFTAVCSAVLASALWAVFGVCPDQVAVRLLPRGFSELHSELHSGREAPLRVAFVGNSYLYFNDLPRLFQGLHGGEQRVRVGDCLRGGASWKVLLQRGNGMSKKFATPNARRPDGSYDTGAGTVQALLGVADGWDYVVMNTYSQEAARATPGADNKSRGDGLEALEVLAPLLEGSRATAVLLVTPAYREPAKGSETIGSWEDFARLQSEGFGAYLRKLENLVSAELPPRVADVNRAFALARYTNESLWRELFHVDSFHPSALGSYLEANVVYCSIFGRLPPRDRGVPADPAGLYARARRMLPPPLEGRMPSRRELAQLRRLAERVCGCPAGGAERAAEELVGRLRLEALGPRSMSQCEGPAAR